MDDNCSNPLLTDPQAVHPNLKPLADALTQVLAASLLVRDCYCAMAARKEECGLPKQDEWPGSPALENAAKIHAEWASATRAGYEQREEKVILGYVEPRWTAIMRQWRGYYRECCAAIASAKELATSPAVAAIMDAGEIRPMQKWTAQATFDLDKLAGLLHPIHVGGTDGMGFIRCGLPPMPTDFPTYVKAVGMRRDELRSIPATAVPPASVVSLEQVEQLVRTVVKSAKDKQQTIVLWGGADNTPYNQRVALSCSAYLEAHGVVRKALQVLKREGHKYSQTSFYSYLAYRDKHDPGWRAGVVSVQVGKLENGVSPRHRGKQAVPKS